MIERFKQLVADYYNDRAEKTDGKTITAEDVNVVLNEGHVSDPRSTEERQESTRSATKCEPSSQSNECDHQRAGHTAYREKLCIQCSK